jgi:putative flippase GtrA
LIQYIGTGLLGLHYAASVVASFMAVNYIGFRLNKEFTFRNEDSRVFGQAARYYGLMGISLATNLVTMALLVDGLGFHYLIAALLVTTIFVLMNFAAHRWITFGPPSK